jgi:hypothetical protein
MQAVQRSRPIRSRTPSRPVVPRQVWIATQKLGGAESGWVEEGQCIEIDHLLEKRHTESQSAGDDFSAADGGNGGALLGLAPEVSGYQSR